MAPIDLASWRRQTSTPAEGKTPKPASDDEEATGSKSNEAPAPPSSVKTESISKPVSTQEAAESNSKPESPTPSSPTRKPVVQIETSSRNIASLRPTTTQETPEGTTSVRSRPTPLTSRGNEATSSPNLGDESTTKISEPVSFTSKTIPTTAKNPDNDNQTLVPSSRPVIITTRSLSPAPVTTSIAAPLTTKDVKPPQPSPPSATIEPEPVSSSSQNNGGNTPVPVTPTPKPTPTVTPVPTVPAGGAVPGNGQGNSPSNPATSAPEVTAPAPPPARPNPDDDQGNITSAIVPLPSPPASTPASPPNGGPGQGNGPPPASPSPSPAVPPPQPPNGGSPPAVPPPSATAPAPPAIPPPSATAPAPPAIPPPSATAPAPPAIPPPSATAPAPPAIPPPSATAPPPADPPPSATAPAPPAAPPVSGIKGPEPFSNAPAPSVTVALPPAGGGGESVSPSVVPPPPATAPAPPAGGQTSANSPSPAIGGSGAAPGPTQVVPSPTVTSIIQNNEAAPTVSVTRATLNIDNGAAGPKVTSLSSVGTAVGAVAGSDEVSFTEVPFTTTIASVSASVFTSGDQVFTSLTTILSTQTLATRKPVPTDGGGVAGIGDSGTSNKTKAAIGGGIGAAIAILIVAFLSWIILRRRRRREQDLRSFLSATPEPFFSLPSHSASPPPDSGARLTSSSPSTITPSASTIPSYLNTSGNPTMSQSETGQNQSRLITAARKKPVPFLDFPLSRPQSIVSGDSSIASSSLSLNPVHEPPMGLISEDPFADPGGTLRNPFDDPRDPAARASGIPALVVSPATPVSERRLSDNRPYANFGTGSEAGHKELGVAY